MKKKLAQFKKLFDFLELRSNDPILSGWSAWKVGPETDKEQRDCHHVHFDGFDFRYWSANVSGHNGDYYANVHTVLPVTEELLDACIKEMSSRAYNKIKMEIRREEEQRLDRKIRNRLAAAIK